MNIVRRVPAAASEWCCNHHLFIKAKSHFGLRAMSGPLH
jgi:hypothetical protein